MWPKLVLLIIFSFNRRSGCEQYADCSQSTPLPRLVKRDCDVSSMSNGKHRVTVIGKHLTGNSSTWHSRRLAVKSQGNAKRKQNGEFMNKLVRASDERSQRLIHFHTSPGSARRLMVSLDSNPTSLSSFITKVNLRRLGPVPLTESRCRKAIARGNSSRNQCVLLQLLFFALSLMTRACLSGLPTCFFQAISNVTR